MPETRFQYGWVIPHLASSQFHGFFVDRDNRILYWPSQDAPGYILDQDSAEEVHANRTAKLSRLLIAVFLFMALVLLAVVALLAKDQPLDDNSLIGPFLLGLLFTSLALLISLVGVVTTVFTKRRREQKLQSILDRFPQVDRPKPQARRLKPSVSMGWVLALASFAGLLLLSIIVFRLIGKPDVLWGSRVLFGGWMLVPISCALILLWREVTGVSKEDAWFYIMEKPDPESNEDNATVARTPGFHAFASRFFEWMGSGWRVWVFLHIPFLILVGVPTIIAVVVLLK